MISGWSDWVASEPDHHEEPPGDRDRLERRTRAGLELLVSERVVDEVPDAALADGFAGFAVRLLPVQPVAAEVHAHRPGCNEHRQLGAHLRREGDGTAQPVEVDARRGEAAEDRRAVWRTSSCRPSRSSRCSSARVGRRTARSTSTASRLRRTTTAIRSSRRRPTTSSRSRGFARAARPAREPEVTRPSDNRRGRDTKTSRPLRSIVRSSPLCAGSCDVSASTSSPSGWR